MNGFNKIIPHSDECAEPILVITSILTSKGSTESEKAVISQEDIAYLKILVPRRKAVLQLYASFYNEKGYIKTLCASYLKTVNGKDVYTVSLDCVYYKHDIYSIKFDCNTSFGKKYFSFCGNFGYFSDYEGSRFQLLVCENKYDSPKWLSEGIIYHVFVDRFCKSSIIKTKKRKDAVYYNDWENGIPEYPEYVGGFLNNNTFFGGNIWGVIEKLDYIQSLGTKTIYLSPIFKAYSNHKYDTGDYMQVDEGFGGDIALSELLKECKKRDMHVILDGVFNHVGEDSIYFNKFGKYDSLGAFQSKESKYYSWFNFYNFPDDYDSWWGIKNLPKVNKIPAFKNYICKDVIKKYMDMGISGWRLDVADELDGSFLKQITKSAKESKKDAVVIGEVWEDASCKSAYGESKHYFDDDRLDGVTNYPLRNGLISFIKSRNSNELKSIIRTLNSHYPSNKINYLMNILGTHDTERIITVLGGESSYGLPNKILAYKKMDSSTRDRAIKMLKDAFVLLMTLPGVPCVYYGDEAGIEGYHDPFNRRTFPWGREDKSLIKIVSHLSKIRNKSNALKNGEIKVFDSSSDVFAFERFTKDESVIVIVNYSDRDIILPIKNEYTNLISTEVYKKNVLIKKDSILLAKRYCPIE